MENQLDLGCIVNFEHANIGITDQGLYSIFYYEGLGFTRDPFVQVSARNMWCNIGLQQLHLPIKPKEQMVGGTLGIIVPSLHSLVTSLEKVKEKLKDTHFSFELVDCTSHEYLPSITKYLFVTTPGGNKFSIFENNPTINYKGGLGMPYVELFCHRDTADKIAAFYKHYFGAHYAMERHGNSIIAKIFVGPNQVFIFKESDPNKVLQYSGFHVCVYVTDFSTIFNKFYNDKLIYSYEGDECETIDDAIRLRQFRTLRVVDPKQEGTKTDLFHMEHEVRSLYHPMYLRPLVNRTGTAGIYCAQ